MNIFQITGPQVEMLRRRLNFTADRHVATVSNLANAETPNYKALELPFKKQLENVLKGKPGPEIQTKTDPRHFPAPGTAPWRYQESSAPAKLDGNNVNMDEEVVRLEEDSIRYESFSQVLSSEFTRIVDAINLGGSRI